jgi:hypothetical protein
MRPDNAQVEEFAPVPTITDRREHDRLAVAVADLLEPLSPSQRVRALGALPPTTLAEIAGAARAVASPQRPGLPVCDGCGSLDHVRLACPNRGIARRLSHTR